MRAKLYKGITGIKDPGGLFFAMEKTRAGE